MLQFKEKALHTYPCTFPKYPKQSESNNKHKKLILIITYSFVLGETNVCFLKQKLTMLKIIVVQKKAGAIKFKVVWQIKCLGELEQRIFVKTEKQPECFLFYDNCIKLQSQSIHKASTNVYKWFQLTVCKKNQCL